MLSKRPDLVGKRSKFKTSNKDYVMATLKFLFRTQIKRKSEFFSFFSISSYFSQLRDNDWKLDFSAKTRNKMMKNLQTLPFIYKGTWSRKNFSFQITTNNNMTNTWEKNEANLFFFATEIFEFSWNDPGVLCPDIMSLK